jgi:hypothetical protein
MRQEDDIASVFQQNLFRQPESNPDARIRQPSSLPKIEKSMGWRSIASLQPASNFQSFSSLKERPEQRSNGNSQKRNGRTGIHAAGGRQEICAVLAWREGLGSCAPYTEEASGEDLQRCSVQEFATMSFGSRV